MARSCLKEPPRHRLVDLAVHFHISTEGAHRALNDCVMNQKCYEEMGRRPDQGERGPRRRISVPGAGRPGEEERTVRFFLRMRQLSQMQVYPERRTVGQDGQGRTVRAFA